MAKKEKRSAASFWELTVLFLLTIALIVMFTQYCLLKNRGNYGGLPLLDAMHSNFSDYSETVSEKKTSFLTPSFIGILSDGEKITPQNAEMRAALIRETRPFVLALLSGNASEASFSSDTAKEAYLERELYGSAHAVYLTFPEEIPAAAIYPLLTGRSFGREKNTFGIRELFLFCTDTGAVSGAALDNDGVLTVLSVSERTSLSFETFTGYLGKEGMGDFSFARLENTARRYAVYNTSVSYPNLAAYTANGDFLTQNSKDAETILSGFGFNPNGTRFYVTRNDYITYVEDMGEMRISSAGNITYTGETSGGIPVSLLCERQTATGSFEDKICAAYKVLQSLNSAQYGGCADFCLTSVSYKDRNLTLIFSYVVNGIPTEDGREAARFVFRDTALISAEVLCRTYMFLESSFSDIPGRLLFAVTAREIGAETETPIAFMPIYSKEEPDAAYTARYAFVYSEPIPSESASVSSASIRSRGEIGVQNGSDEEGKNGGNGS